MKAKGHNICDTLKAIRKQIADANGIDYSLEECHFTGNNYSCCIYYVMFYTKRLL